MGELFEQSELFFFFYIEMDKERLDVTAQYLKKCLLAALITTKLWNLGK